MKRAPDWTKEEMARLMRLRSNLHGRPLGWDEVAATLPGRTVVACMAAFYAARAKQAREAAGVAARKPAAPTVLLQPQQAPPSAKAPAVVSTWSLRTDAELRSRIELVGITAGRLGDPLPGRSALDRKRAGQ